MTPSTQIITFFNKITRTYHSILLEITGVGLVRRILEGGSWAFLI